MFFGVVLVIIKENVTIFMIAPVQLLFFQKERKKKK